MARLRTGVPFCIAVFLVLRIALSLLSVVGVHATTPVEGGGAPGTGTEVPATAGMAQRVGRHDRFDASWFIRIAGTGYREDDASAAFLPGYPLAIRAVAWVVRDELLAALLVSNGAFLAALIVLHALTEEEYDRPMARRSVVLLAAFPTSFFFLAPYSESLFLLLTLVSLRAARRSGWLTAGVSGAAAAATRSAGLALLPALAVEAWTRRTRGTHADRRVPRGGVRRGGPPALRRVLGREGERAGADRCAAAVGTAPRAAARPPRAGDRHRDPRSLRPRAVDLATADVVVTALGIVPLAIGWRRVRTTYVVYAAASLLLPLSDPASGRPLVSMPRYVAVLFPVAWVWASFLSTRARLIAGVAVGAAGGSHPGPVVHELAPVRLSERRQTDELCGTAGDAGSAPAVDGPPVRNVTYASAYRIATTINSAR